MAGKRRYLDLPRSKRRDRFVAVRWRVASDPYGLGLFACRHVLPGTTQWRDLGLDDTARQTHADIWFLSKMHSREGIWYSAQVSTVDQAVCEWLEETIEERMDAQEDRAGDAWRVDWKARSLAWDALTRKDWEQAPIAIGCALDFSYPHAVGVQAVVENENLDAQALGALIQAFYAHDESSWQTPIDWEKHHGAIASCAARQARLYAKLAGADTQRSEGSMQ